MGLVDSLLKLISAQGADALIIPSNEPPLLDKAGEPRPLSMPSPGPEMVAEMVNEVTTPEQRQALADRSAVETHYTADNGQRYAVVIEPRADGPRLVFRREGAPNPSTPAASTPATSMPAAPAQRPSAPSAAQPPLSPSAPPAANSAPTPPLDQPTLDPIHPDLWLDPGPLLSILQRAVHQQASDILLSHGTNARLRVGGAITELRDQPVNQDAIQAFVGPAMSPRAHAELRQFGSIDLAVQVRLDHEAIRYRANLFLQHSGLALALRPIRRDPPTLARLNVPAELSNLIDEPSGLVLMAGVTGSGKSSTLVALVEQVNRTAAKHVITLEDPIEYTYQPQRALIHQRQVGLHVNAFSTGLRAALREDPDIILVGEMRDRATMAAALTAAETGHLVLSTLHSANAAMAIDRIIDSFPEYQQRQVRFQLSAVLRAVVTQRLLPSTRPPTRVPAVELLRVNTAVATKIRDGRGHQLQSEIQKGRHEGMISFELSLATLVRRSLLDHTVALQHAPDPNLLAHELRGL